MAEPFSVGQGVVRKVLKAHRACDAWYVAAKFRSFGQRPSLSIN